MKPETRELRLGVLGSGKGSNYLVIQQSIQAHRLDATVAVVVSDHSDSGILQHARNYNVPAIALPQSRFRTKLEPEIEQELVSILQRHQVDLVVLAGYMRVIKEPMLQAFHGRIVNIHPSLLPAFKGLEAWRQALTAGAQKTGCTVHYVTAGVDDGPILGQREVPILKDDTPETLHARIQQAEHVLYPEVLQSLTSKILPR